MGPAPKARRARDRDNEARVPLPVGGCEGDAPRLPGSRGYLQRTRDWYVTWAGSPQSSQFLPTDWQRLAMLAPLVDAYFREPCAKLASEIRLNESLLGATALDRLRLRWEPTANTERVELASERLAGEGRRERLLRAVKDG